MEVLKGPECTEVEDGAEIDEEGLLPLAGEDLAPAFQLVDSRRGQSLVIGS